MAMSGETDPARWKQKYYDSLEQIEKKEKQWQGAENLLRRGIAAPRKLIEDIGGSVARLDQARSRVTRWLGRCWRSCWGGLGKRLEDVRDEAELTPLTDELVPCCKWY